MLFSHQPIVDLLAAAFECSWESVCPVPKVHIDFGNGSTLDRTLHGNVVSYVCAPDGRTVEILPGVVEASAYTSWLTAALDLAQRVDADEADGESVVAQLMETHGARAASALMDSMPQFQLAVSKSGIELPLERALGPQVPNQLALDRPGQFDTLAADTDVAFRVLAPRASAVWNEQPFASPTDYTWRMYAHALEIDLADPYLGLAPQGLGGEVGRTSP